MQREIHTAYEIEKGIPFTPQRRTSAGESKYPVKGMEIGDSFFIATNKPASARNTVAHAARSVGYTIQCQRDEKVIDGKKVKGLRVFRVADVHADQEPKRRKGAAK